MRNPCSKVCYYRIEVYTTKMNKLHYSNKKESFYKKIPMFLQNLKKSILVFLLKPTLTKSKVLKR